MKRLHMKTRKLLTGIICLVMAVTMTAGVPAVTFAADKSTTATQGVYWFDPHEVGMDLTDTFIYDDALLTGDSLGYNKKLATMSYELTIASISSEREPKTEAGYKNKSRNLKAYLEDNGFLDFDTNADYKKKMTTTTMGVACAHKKIKDNGKTYTLLAIVPRSAGYESEWGGNFMMGEYGDHEGFRNGKNKVLDFAKEYVARNGIKGDIKVWTAGYSRGAGVTNQVAANLIADPKGALGSGISLVPNNIYCYTFGTPNSAGDTDAEWGAYNDPKFNYIHNTWEAYDIVTVAPPQSLGFNRYGTNTHYASADRKAKMLRFLKLTNPKVYELYMNGGDPDNFAPKTIDMKALFEEKTFTLADDPDSYLPDNQAEFMALMEQSLKHVFGDRQTYYNKYQKPFELLCGYFFSHMDTNGELISSIKSNERAIPLAALMYVSFMLEEYGNETFSAQGTKEEIQKAVDLLGDTINQIIAGGGTVSQELQNAYTRLQNSLALYNDLDSLCDDTHEAVRILYSQTMEQALTDAGADQETIDGIANGENSSNVSRALTFMLFRDDLQTEVGDKVISFENVGKQMKHFATFIGNSGSFMRPHNNEVILSWLRTQDPNHDDFAKETDVQKLGYRRVFISSTGSADVTGTVRDDSGNKVATFKNGILLSSSDPWVAITTCDTGNWLRLPLQKGYTIDLSTSQKTNLTLTVKEYSVYDGTTVRTVTKDKKYNWKNLSVVKGDQIKWVLPQAAKDGRSKLPSGAYNYIKLNKAVPDKVTIVTYVKAGKKAIIVNWKKVSGATGYVVQYRKAGASKWTTKKTAKATYTITKLKKGARYDVRVAAVKKTGSGTFRGKYSAVSHRYIKNVGPVKVKAGKGKIKVTWKKDKKATGYKVCIAKNKAMTKGLKVITVKGKNKTSRTIRNLKKGTRYYVEVRAVWPKGKTEYTGSSATKSAKVR